jgi:OOP family OmpA-OmpF porin
MECSGCGWRFRCLKPLVSEHYLFIEKEDIMTKIIKISLALVLGLSVASPVLAQTRTPAQLDSYIWDTRGVVWRSGTGLCWRTARWTPAGAIRECDPHLFKDTVAKKDWTPVREGDRVAPIVPQQTSEKVVYQAEAFFDFDKSVLKPEGRRSLDELADKMKLIDLELIIATGHTDSIGTHAYNDKLSMRRANAVKSYLVNKGVPADQIKAEGKGEREPVATNKTREGRAKNRRVEIQVFGNQR